MTIVERFNAIIEGIMLCLLEQIAGDLLPERAKARIRKHIRAYFAKILRDFEAALAVAQARAAKAPASEACAAEATPEIRQPARAATSPRAIPQPRPCPGHPSLPDRPRVREMLALAHPPDRPKTALRHTHRRTAISLRFSNELTWSR